MSLKIDRVQLEIIVQQDKARQQMMQLEKEMKDANTALRAIKKQYGENSAEYRAQEKVVKDLRTQYDKLFEGLGLGKLSLKELCSRQKELNQILRNMDPSLPEWQKYNNQLKEVNGRIKELKGTAVESKLSIGKLADGFNRFFGVIAAGAAALTGFVMGIKSLRDERNKLDESQAGLKALTGLDDNSVKWLTDQAKTLSTTMTAEGLRVRQSANEILDAFMLVGSAKPELLGDKVALEQVSEEAMRLQAAAKDIKLDEAVDALTLSLNQYGASADDAARYSNVLAAGSKAGAANIASQAASIRVAGTAAASANTSIEQTVGLIETLAYKGIKNEIAGTGLKKFFLTLQTGANDTNPKIVGLDKALENLKNKNMDAGALKKMFGEEGFNVASVIINSTDKVKDFTEAVTDTSIAIEQSAINSDTYAAKVAQAKNEMKLAGIELIEKLNPAITVSTNMVTNIIKYLPGLIDWFQRWSTTIVTLTAAIVAYTIAVNAATIATKLKAFWLDKVCVAAKALFATLRAHPFLMFATAVTAIIALYRDWSKASDKLTESERRLRDIRQESTKAISADKAEIEHYLTVAKDEKRSKEERLTAIRRLNEISPEYLGNISLETINTKEATKAVNAYVDSLLVKQNIENANKKKGEITDEINKIYKDGDLDKSFLGDMWDGFVNGAAKGINQVSLLLTGAEDKWATETIYGLEHQAVNKVNSLESDIKELDKYIEEQRNQLIKVQTDATGTETPVTGGGGGGSTKDTVYQSRLDALELAKTQELNILKQKVLDGEATEEQYQDQLYQIDIKYLSLRKELLDSFGKDSSSIQGQILDKMIAETNRQYKAIKDLPKPNLDEDTEDINSPVSDYEIQKYKQTLQFKQDLLESQRANNLISEAEYQDKLADIEQQKSEQRAQVQQATLQTISNVAGGFSQLFSAMQDSEISKIESKYDKQIKAAKKAGKDTTKLEEQKEEEVNAVKSKYADKQFAAAVLQITSTTAVAAMEAYKAMASIPVVGPALGVAAAAAAIASGAAQLAVAKQSRDEAKGLKSGGYSDNYVEGYTSTGNPDDVAGVIPVHKNEFVANHDGVANPHVRQFLDIFDVAQRNGNIRMLNTTQILEQVRTRSGYYSGGFTSSSSSDSSTTSLSSDNNIVTLLQRIIMLLNSGNNSLQVIAEKELIIDVKKVRDGLKHIDKLESNVSR